AEGSRNNQPGESGDGDLPAEEPQAGESTPPETEEDPDRAARTALAPAREAARANGVRTSRPGGRRRQDGAYLPSNPRSARDTAPMSDAVHHLAQQRGWNPPLSIGGVIGRWREVV